MLLVPRVVPAPPVLPRVLAVAAIAGILAACGGPTPRTADTAAAAATAAPVTPASTPNTASALPAPVVAVGHFAEDAYDMAKAGTWPKARASVDSLKQAAATMPASPSSAASGTGDLTTAVAALDRAVTARDRTTAMRTANHLTQLEAQLAEPYHPSVPTAVTLLDYDGRALEIWSEARDQRRLRQTAAAMHDTWAQLRPQVVARGGTAEATRFDALVAQTDAATTPSVYAALATPVLNAVDTLEKVFTR